MIFDIEWLLSTLLFCLVLIFIAKYFLTLLKFRRFKRMAGIVRSNEFKSLTDSQKEIAVDHFTGRYGQLKYGSDIYNSNAWLCCFIDCCCYGAARKKIYWF